MAAPLEVIVSSDSASQLWNLTVFDLHSGSSLLSYRGGNTAARGLAVLAGRYLLAAQLAKNFINVWEIQRKVRGARAGRGLLPVSAQRRGVRDDQPTRSVPVLTVHSAFLQTANHRVGSDPMLRTSHSLFVNMM